MARAGEPAEEVLDRLRMPLVRRAELGLRGERRTAYTLDVGLRGVFVEWPEPLPIGESVELRFHLPGSARPVRADSKVAWWNPPGEAARARRLPGGVGLEFVSLDPADRRRIRELVLEHWRGDLTARRFHPAWPGTGDSPEG
jgi:uncharacterized protein (TIGR02266 family)